MENEGRSNQVVGKRSLVLAQRAYYASTQALHSVGMRRVDSVGSATDNGFGSTASGYYERDDHLEPALVLHDPSRTQLDMLGAREDSGERGEDW